MMKNHKIFSNIDYDIHYHLAESQLKSNLCME
jgi:hypothetical protein